MYCGKCGKQIADNAKFCTGCGAPQNVPVTPTPVEPVVTNDSPVETVAVSDSPVEPVVSSATPVEPAYIPTQIYKPSTINNITTNGQPVLTNLLDNIKSAPVVRAILYLLMIIFMGINGFKVKGYETAGEFSSDGTKFSLHDSMKSGMFSFTMFLLIVALLLAVAYALKIKYVSGKRYPNIICILASLWLLLILALNASDQDSYFMVRVVVIIKMTFAGYIHLFSTLGSIVCSVLAMKKRKEWK